MTEVNNILEAIRLQALDGCKVSEVEMNDLLTLATHIKLMEDQIIRLQLEKATVTCQLAKATRSNVSKLRSYK